MRAARFSHRSGAGTNFAGSASFDDLRALAPRAGRRRPARRALDRLQGAARHRRSLRQLPVPVVIDHMGGFDVDAGVDEPGFRACSLLASGQVWVKLCAYRNLLAAPTGKPARPFQQAMIGPTRSAWCGAATGRNFRSGPQPTAPHWPTGSGGGPTIGPSDAPSCSTTAPPSPERSTSEKEGRALVQKRVHAFLLILLSNSRSKAAFERQSGLQRHIGTEPHDVADRLHRERRQTAICSPIAMARASDSPARPVR